MKKILSLALAFTVSSLGLLSLLAQPVRAQQVASASKSISEMKEEYERFLAVERDPSTPAEVKEVNHQLLEARRTQLRTAIETRLGALKKYQSSMGGTLSSEESLVIGNSIQALERDLSGLTAVTKAPAAAATSPRARLIGATRAPRPSGEQPTQSAQSAQPARTSYTEETAATTAPKFDTGASAPKEDRALAITSPDRDKTVHVGEVELEIGVYDDNIDDIMVAVYTPASPKPVSARILSLKRSDKGTKSVVVALSKGDNRVEVTDLKRNEIKAERNITFAPPDAPAIGGSPSGDNAASLFSSRRSDAAIEPTTLRAEAGPPTTICGQLTPASLNQTIGLIKSSDDLSDLAARFTSSKESDLRLVHSTINGDDCLEITVIPDTTFKIIEGMQKEAVVSLLKDARKKLKDIELPNEFKTLSQATLQKQILLLNQYFGNVAVHITKEDGSLVAVGFTNRDGNYLINFTPPDANATYFVSTEADNYRTKRKIVPKGDAQRVNLTVDDQPVSLLARAIVGYEQSGVSSATREQNYFFDLFLRKTMPFHQKIHPDFGERFSTWGDIRFDSVPQAGDSALGTFISQFSQQAANVKVKDVARVFDFLAGIEIRLSGNNALLPSFDRDTKQKFTLSLIAAGGTVTPLNSQETIATFRVFPDAPGLPPEARGKEFVSFIAADRDRFFRQYFVGLRLQTFFFNRYNIPIQRFPAQLDFTVGQSEFITGGSLHGPVIRIEGYYPLPYNDLKWINLFGTAQLRPGRANATLPLVLQAAPAGTIVPASNVALILAPQPNRDYYRAGFGIDFISFVDFLMKMGNK
jgi:hypothetical protein